MSARSITSSRLARSVLPPRPIYVRATDLPRDYGPGNSWNLIGRYWPANGRPVIGRKYAATTEPATVSRSEIISQRTKRNEKRKKGGGGGGEREQGDGAIVKKSIEPVVRLEPTRNAASRSQAPT